MIVHCPSHTESIFRTTDFPAVVDWAVSEARKEKIDAIAGCGHSGLLVAGAMGYILNIPVIAVRKTADHAVADGYRVNAVVDEPILRWGIVDDLVSTGETIRRIVSETKEAQLVRSDPALLLLYKSIYYEPEEIMKSIRFRPLIKIMGRDS